MVETASVGLLEGLGCECQSPQAEIKLRQQGHHHGRQRNVAVMTAPLSYIKVHPPADPPPPPPPPPLLCPHPPAAIWLWGNYNGIMSGIKALELITGHNTSFSALIRRLIGNRFACFPPRLLSRRAADWGRIQTVGFFHIIMSAWLSLPDRWSVCGASSPVSPSPHPPLAVAVLACHSSAAFDVLMRKGGGHSRTLEKLC